MTSVYRDDYYWYRNVISATFYQYLPGKKNKVWVYIFHDKILLNLEVIIKASYRKHSLFSFQILTLLKAYLTVINFCFHIYFSSKHCQNMVNYLILWIPHLVPKWVSHPFIPAPLLVECLPFMQEVWAQLLATSDQGFQVTSGRSFNKHWTFRNESHRTDGRDIKMDVLCHY